VLLEDPAAPDEPDEPDEPAAPPDEPEEPAAPEEPPEASLDEAVPPGERLVVDAASASLLRATFAFFAFFAVCLAPVFFGGTLLSASVLSVGATATWFGCPALAAVLLVPFTAAVVELGVALGGWLNDVESVFMAGAVDDGFAANADALASATIDVMTNIGASLRI